MGAVKTNKRHIIKSGAYQLGRRKWKQKIRIGMAQDGGAWNEYVNNRRKMAGLPMIRRAKS